MTNNHDDTSGWSKLLATLCLLEVVLVVVETGIVFVDDDDEDDEDFALISWSISKGESSFDKSIVVDEKSCFA